MAERREAELALKAAHDRLEHHVGERTAELTAANAHLKAEIVERKRAEEQLAANNAELQREVRAREAVELERRTLERQLFQAQKMEAVGRLAGGVAHDFNNALSVILSYAELIAGDLKPGDPLRADVGEIRAAGLRAAGLTRQLLAFSRQEIVDLRVLDLNQTIVALEKMLGRLLGADVEPHHAPRNWTWEHSGGRRSG